MDICHAEPDLVIRLAAIRLEFWHSWIAFPEKFQAWSRINTVKCLNKTQTKFKQNKLSKNNNTEQVLNNTSVAGL